MGRPKGSKNKVKALPIVEASPDVAPLTKRLRGRPKGAKNKPKLALVPVVQDGELEMLDDEPTKKRGRPKGSKSKVAREKPTELQKEIAIAEITWPAVIDYEFIKSVTGKGTVLSYTDLTVLSPQSDPFYVGSPSSRRDAKWFKGLWQQFGFTTGIHLRRMHYQIISQDIPVLMPNGLPYRNTENCWHWFVRASAAARYLKEVGFDAFVDHRNPPPIIRLISKPAGLVELDVTTDYRFDDDDPILAFPEWVDQWPAVKIENFEGEQRYHLGIWAEKSTQNDILDPLCERYRVDLITGLGELSITQIYDAVQQMLREAAGKPVRICYLSDFDPAGECMPVSAARKLEWQVRDQWDTSQYGPPDVRLTQIALTEDQCQQYNLPRTPIKEGEKRDKKWKERHGEGGTELDALEALYPGTLATMVRGWIERYRDTGLSHRVWQAKHALQVDLDTARRAIMDKYQEEIDRLESEYQALKDEYAPRLEALDEEVRECYQNLRDELQEMLNNEIDIDDYPVPEAEHANEDGDNPLYDSTRTYTEQLAVYKAFQGRKSITDRENGAA